MESNILTRSALGLGLCSLLAIACGGADDVSAFPAPGPAPTTEDVTPPPDLGDEVMDPPTQQSCAAATVEGKIAPVHLVIAQDISGSMCQLPTEPVDLLNTSCARPGTKWELTQAALNAFFKDPASANTFVSIIPWSGLGCGTFETPLAPVDVALPDTAGSLAAALGTVVPTSATPTSSAINGAVAYAKRLQASLKDGGRVVIAVATDGEPTACGDQSSALSAATLARLQGFGPYVIGVGSLIPKLDALAAAAGTNGSKAFLVQGNIAQELNKALTTIKQNAIKCEVALPKPQNGDTLDYQKVNVVTNDGKGDVTVPYSQDCSDTSGWRYLPDATKPERIELCAARCEGLKQSGQVSIKMVLGCATQKTK